MCTQFTHVSARLHERERTLFLGFYFFFFHTTQKAICRKTTKRSLLVFGGGDSIVDCSMRKIVLFRKTILHPPSHGNVNVCVCELVAAKWVFDRKGSSRVTELLLDLHFFFFILPNVFFYRTKRNNLSYLNYHVFLSRWNERYAVRTSETGNKGRRWTCNRVVCETHRTKQIWTINIRDVFYQPVPSNIIIKVSTETKVQLYCMYMKFANSG